MGWVPPREPPSSLGQPAPTPAQVPPPGGPDYSHIQPDYGRPYAPQPAALAGFWLRAFAALLDILLLGVVTLVLALVAGGAVASSVSLALGAAYFIYLHSATGQSLGMRPMSIKVIDMDTGGTIDVGRAALRWLVANIVTVGLILVAALGPVGAIVGLLASLVSLVGYLWMLWDASKQTWHDKAARSVVVLIR